MKYSFHPLAVRELTESINYYEDNSPGLGLEFSKEIYSTIQRILQFPNSLKHGQKYHRIAGDV